MDGLDCIDPKRRRPMLTNRPHLLRFERAPPTWLGMWIKQFSEENTKKYFKLQLRVI